MTTSAKGILVSVLALAMMGCGTSDGLATGSISCSNRLDDWWRVHVSNPSVVTITVDTVSFNTAFDPAFDVYTVAFWSSDPNRIVLGSYVSGADDDFECTYPPRDYECPTRTYNASADFLLVVENLGSCRGTVGEYSLDVFGADRVTYLGREPR